jgi:hypothetical protein
LSYAAVSSQLISPTLVSEKSEKKQYLNGLMKAARFFDVSHEELQQQIPQGLLPTKTCLEAQASSDRYLDIPTFIRNK